MLARLLLSYTSLPPACTLDLAAAQHAFLQPLLPLRRLSHARPSRMASVAPFSSATYTPLPNTPTRSQRSHSANPSMYSDKDGLSPPNTPPRRLSASPFALSSPRSSRKLPTLLGVGALSLLAWVALGRSQTTSHALYAPARLQLDSRGRPAVDFEAAEVPEEWQCNPYKEHGKLVVDLEQDVSGAGGCSAMGLRLLRTSS